MFVFNLIYQHLSCRVGHSYRDFIFLCTHVRSSFCMHSSGTDLKIHVSVPQVSLYLWYVYTRFVKDIYLSKTYIYLSKYKQHWNFTYVCQCSEKHSTLSKPKVATCLRRTARAGPGSAVFHMFVWNKTLFAGHISDVDKYMGVFLLTTWHSQEITVRYYA